MNFGKEQQEKIVSILKKSALSAHTDMACISIEKSLSSIKNFENFVKKLESSKEIVVCSIGKSSITFVVHEKHLNLAKSIFSHEIQDINQKVGIIALKCIKDVNFTPGVTAFISSIFTDSNVPMYEMISTYTDYVIVVEEKVTYKIAALIKEIIGC